MFNPLLPPQYSITDHSRRYLCCCSSVLHVVMSVCMYMVSNKMVTWITDAHNASCFVLFRNFKFKVVKDGCYHCFQIGYLNDHLFGKELFILVNLRVFRERLSICNLFLFPFGFKGRMWDLITLVPDRCLSFYFFSLFCKKKKTMRGKIFWGSKRDITKVVSLWRTRRTYRLELEKLCKPLLDQIPL